MKRSKTIASGPWPRLQRAWDVRAACNFVGGGAGTGLLMAALIAALAGRAWLVALFAGLAFIGFGLLMVLLEIGKPWRAFNVFLHPQTSWMTREGVVSLPLFALGGLALVAGWAGYADAALWLLAGVTLCAAAFLYCQARILRGARGIPAWRELALTPYILVSGPAEGFALFLAFAAIGGAPAWSLWLALALIAGRALAWVHFRTMLGRRGAPEATLDTLDRMGPVYHLTGHGLPLALIVLVLAGMPGAPWLLLVAGLAAALAGWNAKRVLITRAAHTQGVAIPRTPIRGRGESRPGARPGWVGR